MIPAIQVIRPHQVRLLGPEFQVDQDRPAKYTVAGSFTTKAR